MTKKISLIKILMLFLCTAFILGGCRQELLKDDEEKFDPNVSKLQVVKLSDIPHVTKYIKSKTGRSDLKLPIANSQFALSKESIDFTNLESSMVVKKTDGDIVYYVFSIENAGDEKTIYTYEVKEVREEIVKSEIIEYASDVPYGDRPFEVLNGFTGKVISYDLEGNQISVNSFLEGDSGCPPTNPPTSSGGGATIPGSGFPTFPGGGWIGGSGGGGSSGGSSGGSGSDCGEWVFSHHIWDSNNNLTGYIYTNDCGETRLEEAVDEISPNANKTALTAYCNEGSGIILIPIKNATPCERIKSISNEKTFKDNITALEGMTGYDSERGYRMGYPLPNTSQTGIQNQFLQNMPGTKQVNLKAFSNTFVIMHTHYDGLYPIFSPEDIIFFNNWLVWAKSWNDIPTNTPKIDLKNLTFVVVTSYGTYILKFDGTDVVSLPTYSIEEFEDMNKDYIKRMDRTHTNGNFDNEKLEKEYLKFVSEKMNMAGLKLFKRDSNGTNTEIYLENGQRKTNECP